MSDAGTLNQRIDIQERFQTTNTVGERVKSWVNRHTEISAEAHPLRGREFFDAARNQSEVTARFRIRYSVARMTIDSTMRVIWRGVAYDIAAEPINLDGGNEWIDLMCKAGVRDAKR